MQYSHMDMQALETAFNVSSVSAPMRYFIHELTMPTCVCQARAQRLGQRAGELRCCDAAQQLDLQEACLLVNRRPHPHGSFGSRASGQMRCSTGLGRPC